MCDDLLSVGESNNDGSHSREEKGELRLLIDIIVTVYSISAVDELFKSWTWLVDLLETFNSCSLYGDHSGSL